MTRPVAQPLKVFVNKPPSVVNIWKMKDSMNKSLGLRDPAYWEDFIQSAAKDLGVSWEEAMRSIGEELFGSPDFLFNPDFLKS